MTTSSVINREILEDLLKDAVPLSYDRTPQFNGLKRADQDAILHVYKVKKRRGELGSFQSHFSSALEFVTRQYQAQLCAFQDVLTRRGFSPTESVSASVNERIAILTYSGTVMLLGKPRPLRFVKMSRIHTRAYNRDKSECRVLTDLSMRKRPRIYFNPQGAIKFSYARGLATNPHGNDGNFLSESVAILTGIGTATQERLLLPRELEIEPAQK